MNVWIAAVPAFDGVPPLPPPERETVKLTVEVPRALRDAFAAAMRARGLKMAKALRLVMEDLAGTPQARSSVTGSARKLNLRLHDAPRAKLLEQAEARGTSPAAWATALLEGALMGGDRPVWGKRETGELRALYAELKAAEQVASDPVALDAVRRAMKRVLDNLARLEAALKSR